MRPPPQRVPSARAALLPLVAIALVLTPAGAWSSWRGLTDVASVDPTAEKALSLGTLTRGQEIEILTREGARLHGRYQRLERMPASTYAARVESTWAAGDPEALPPAPGAWITVRPRHGAAWEGRLDGYAYRGIEVTRDGKPASVIPFRALAGVVERDHREWSAAELDDQAGAGRLPAFSVMVVEFYGRNRLLPTERVGEVSGRGSDTLTIVPIVVAAAMVAVVVAGGAFMRGSGGYP